MLLWNMLSGNLITIFEREDLNEDFYHMMDSMHHMGAAAKQFGWLMPLLLSIPERITTRVDKGMAAFAALQNVSLSIIARAT